MYDEGVQYSILVMWEILPTTIIDSTIQAGIQHYVMEMLAKVLCLRMWKIGCKVHVILSCMGELDVWESENKYAKVKFKPVTQQERKLICCPQVEFLNMLD